MNSLKRFLPWLLPIVVLLGAIPFLLLAGAVAAAKIAGVLVVVLTAVAVRYWTYQAAKKRSVAPKVGFTINERYFLDEAFPYYKGMPATEKKRLEERAGLLLAALSFDRFDHSDPEKNDCVAFAVVLALLTRDLPYTISKGNVVVFRENQPAELTRQGEQVLLFVSLEELKTALAATNSPAIEAVLAPGTAENLQKLAQS